MSMYCHFIPFRINNCVGELNQKYFIQFLFYIGELMDSFIWLNWYILVEICCIHVGIYNYNYIHVYVFTCISFYKNSSKNYDVDRKIKAIQWKLYKVKILMLYINLEIFFKICTVMSTILFNVWQKF